MSSNTDRDQILPRRIVEDMIARGKIIVVFEGDVLRLDSWLDKHPGGRLAILHMVGKDATDEIIAYHPAATIRTMKAYRIGRKPTGPWVNMTPAIRGGIYRPISTPTSTSLHGAPCIQPTAAAVRSRVPLSGINVRPAKHPHGGNDGGDDNGGTPSRRGRQGEEARKGSGSCSTAPMCPMKYTDWALQRGVDHDLQDYPSLDPAVQQDIVRKYRLLHQQILDEGLYDCRYGEYAKEMVRYVSLFALFLVALHHAWYMTAAVFLGLFWHQIMFTAHDAGHRAVTQSFVVDTLLAMFIADFCCGLSIGWWKSSHNVHHLVTNHPDHDPDIQNVPIFATCPSFFRSIYSTYYDFLFVWDSVAEILVPYQQYTYYPIMGIARFNLYLLSWLHVLSAKSSSLGSSKAFWIRPTEIAFMSCYWFLFGYCLLWCTLPTWTARVAFVLVSHIITMPLHVQITLSHWGMSTAELGEAESFPQRQLRTTMDVDCPASLDFIHGGLQFQAAHHLFPRVPRHNLRRVQALSKQFAKDAAIPYSVMGFVDGNRKVMGRLGEVSEQVRILISCQKYMAETGMSGLH
ncbi:Delta-9 acyl-CoA desaturase [Pleurostoma richardsiae]|uniref:Delta 8-(E)-sphingolipid desaturase n=1 Tax=Pleurostoma richardsiae TaxID=41990 RepID=A0AA38R8U5_9PEZI|nr:Delta-9 acyl-CoA desaturase [Pleurostoma richardsiae]